MYVCMCIYGFSWRRLGFLRLLMEEPLMTAMLEIDSKMRRVGLLFILASRVLLDLYALAPPWCQKHKAMALGLMVCCKAMEGMARARCKYLLDWWKLDLIELFLKDQIGLDLLELDWRSMGKGMECTRPWWVEHDRAHILHIYYHIIMFII